MSQCVHFLGACADFRDSTAVFRLNYHSVVDVTLRTSDLQRRVFEDERAYKSHRVFVHQKSNAVVFGGSVMREYGGESAHKCQRHAGTHIHISGSAKVVRYTCYPSTDLCHPLKW